MKINYFPIFFIFILRFRASGESQKQVKKPNFGDKEKARGPLSRNQLKAYENCGCGTGKGTDINYEPSDMIGFFRMIEQQIHFYTQLWAQSMENKQIEAGDVLILAEKIEITPFTQAEENYIKSFNIQKYQKENQKYQKNLENCLDKNENFRKHFQETINFLVNFKSSTKSPTTSILTQKIGNALEDYKDYCNYCYLKNNKSMDFKSNECAAQLTKDILPHITGYKINMRFVGDQEVEKSFYVIFFLNSVKKLAKYSYVFQPYFVQDLSKIDFENIKAGFEKTLQLKNLKKQMFTVEQLYTMFNKLPQNEKKDQNNFQSFSKFTQKYLVQINGSGFYYQPGIVEYRTSCNLALRTLRLAIQTAFKIYYSPSILIHHCPPMPENLYPGDKTGIGFFFNDPPQWEDKPPIEKNQPKKDPPVKKPNNPPNDTPKLPPKKIPKIPPVTKVKEPPLNLYEIRIIASYEVEELENIFTFDEEKNISEILTFGCFDFQEQRQYQRFSIELSFLLSMIFTTENISILCDSDEKAYINYKNKKSGKIDFILDGDQACSEIELILFGQELAAQECHLKTVSNLDDIPEGTDKASLLASKSYGQLINNLYEVINNLYKIDSSSITTNDFYNYFLKIYELEQPNRNSLKLISKNFSKIKYSKNEQYEGEIRNSIEGQVGTVDYFYFEEYKYSPIKITQFDSKKGFFKLRVDVGFKFLEFYIPSVLYFTEDDLKEIKSLYSQYYTEVQIKDLKKAGFQISENINMPKPSPNLDSVSKDLGKKLYQQKIKEKLKFNYKNIFDEYFREVINSDIQNFSIEIFKFENKNEIEYPDILQKYFKTDLLNFQVLAATFNFLMMKYNNDRLPGKKNQKFSEIIEQFNKVQEIKENEIQANLSIIQKFWKNHFSLEGDSMVTTPLHPYANVYGLDTDSSWLYYLEGIEGQGLQKLSSSMTIEKMKAEQVIRNEGAEKLVKFDLEYLNEKFLYDQNNYASALFGSNEFNAKSIVRLWRYNYHPLKVFHIRFETMKFHTDHMIAESDYQDVVLEFNKIIDQHNKHYKSLMQNYKTTAGKNREITLQTLLKVIEDTIEELDNNCQNNKENINFQSKYPYKLYKANNADSKKMSEQILFYYDDKEQSNVLFDKSTEKTEEDNLLPAFRITKENLFYKFQIYNANFKYLPECKKKSAGEKATGKNYFSEYKFPIVSCYSAELSFKRFFYNQLFHFEFGKFSSLY